MSGFHIPRRNAHGDTSDSSRNSWQISYRKGVGTTHAVAPNAAVPDRSLPDPADLKAALTPEVQIEQSPLIVPPK